MAEQAQHADHKHQKQVQPAKPVQQGPVVQAESADLLALQRTVLNPGLAAPGDILGLQRTAGNRAVSRLVQAKLTVGPANDRYEQEADRVAEQVMSSQQPATSSQQPAVQRQEDEEEVQTKPLAASITPLVQRQEDEEEVQTKPLAAGITPLLQRQEDEEEIQTSRLVQRRGDGSFEVDSKMESHLAGQKGGGQPLPGDVRSYMEPRFGTDFGDVRVHTGGDAVQMNRDLDAHSFTHGRDIYFGAGQYDPGTSSGKSLVAHELTHVVQQTGRRSAPRPATESPGSIGLDRLQRGKTLTDVKAFVEAKATAAKTALTPGPKAAAAKAAVKGKFTAAKTALTPGPRAAAAKAKIKGATRADVMTPINTVLAPTSIADIKQPTSVAGQKVLKGGLGIAEGAAKLLLGPITWFRFIHPNQLESLRKDTYQAQYGSGKLGTLCKVLSTVSKTLEETAMVSAWVGLILGIIGVAAGAATLGASAAPMAAAAAICGWISLACAAVVFILKGILVGRNIGRLASSNTTTDKKLVRNQMIKDIFGMGNAAVAIATGGLGAAGNFGAALGEGGINIARGGAGAAEQFIGTATTGAAADAIVNAGYEGLNAKRIQRQATGAPETSQGAGGPSPEDVQAMADLGQVFRDMASLGRVEQELNKKEKANVADTTAGVAETLPKAQEGLGKALEIGTKAEEGKRETDQLEAKTEALGHEENAEPETVQQVEATAARAEKAAARDPKDVKPEEVQQISAEVRSMTPKQKKSLASRAGGAMKQFFAGLMRRLTTAKNTIKRLMAKAKAKIVLMVLKATGSEEPAREFVAGLGEAKETMPEHSRLLDEEEKVTADTIALADHGTEVTKR